VGQGSVARVKDFYSETASSVSSHSECASFQAILPPPVRRASQQAEISAEQDNDNAGSDKSSGSDSSDEGSVDTDVPVAVRRPKPFNMSLLAADRVSQRQRLPSISEYRSASDDSSDTSPVAEEDPKSSSVTSPEITDASQLVAGQQVGDKRKQSDEKSSMESDSGKDDAAPADRASVPQDDNDNDKDKDNDDSYESVSSASNEHDVEANKFHSTTIVPTKDIDSVDPTNEAESSNEVPTNSKEAQQPPVTPDATANTSTNAANESHASASKVSNTTKSTVNKANTSGAKQNGSPRSAARKNSNTGSYTAPTRTTLVRQAEPERNFQVKMATLLKKTPSKK